MGFLNKIGRSIERSEVMMVIYGGVSRKLEKIGSGIGGA